MMAAHCSFSRTWSLYCLPPSKCRRYRVSVCGCSWDRAAATAAMRSDPGFQISLDKCSTSADLDKGARKRVSPLHIVAGS